MKFSLKKGDKKPAAPKAAKPAARQSSGGSRNVMAGVQAFLANHLEKLGVGLMGLVALFLVYSGFNKERVATSPEQVTAAINAAKAKIDQSTWSEVRQTRYAEPDVFDQQASEDTAAIKAEDFALSTPFHPILQERAKRRTDPVLLAPLEIEVRSGYGPLAIRASAADRVGDVEGLLAGTRPAERTRPLPDKYRGQGGRGEIFTSGAPTESRFFVAVTGLVPVRPQQEAFKAALANAADYRLERDTPRYLALNVQRAEVAADGKLSDWTDLDALRVMRNEPRKWESRLEERAAREHVIRSLMMPLPPLVFRNVSDWAVHSKIPIEDLTSEGAVREERAVEGEVTEEGDAAVDLFSDSGTGEGERRGERASEDRGEPSAEGGRSEGAYGDLAEQLKMEIGLLRFFDFTAVPGKSYRYRVQLLLEDPNNPKSHQRPPSSACENEVVVRRQANPKKFFVESPWSEPSPVANIPTGRTIYAGLVQTPKLYPVSESNKRIRLPRRPGEEPVATVLAVAWDREQALDVPAELQVRRGAVVNGTITTEVADPAKQVVRPLENYPFQTNAIVLDIAGGESLDRKRELTAPGAVLVMTEDGRVSYHDELLDFSQYDYHKIPPDENEAMDGRLEGPAAEDRGEEGRDESRGRRGRGRGEGSVEGEPGVEERGEDARGEQPRSGRRGRGGR